MGPFAFLLGDAVELTLSGEQGVVIGRAEYTESEPQYLVRYVTAQNCQVEAWLSQSAISPVQEE